MTRRQLAKLALKYKGTRKGDMYAMRIFAGNQYDRKQALKLLTKHKKLIELMKSRQVFSYNEFKQNNWSRDVLNWEFNVGHAIELAMEDESHPVYLPLALERILTELPKDWLDPRYVKWRYGEDMKSDFTKLRALVRETDKFIDGYYENTEIGPVKTQSVPDWFK